MTALVVEASQPLAAVLAEPAHARATAVLIPGSGPVNRDGDARRFPAGIQRQLSDTLALGGIASLRWDKRGVGESGGNFLSTGFHDGVDDALAMVDHAATFGRPVVIIGHSEGAAIASRIAVERPEVAGIVLLSGYARSGMDVLRWQSRMLRDQVPAPVRAILAMLRTDLETQTEKNRQRIFATTSDVERVGGVRLNARWFREFMAYEPMTDLAVARPPVLAITGSFDLQSPPEDLDRIAAGRTAATETVVLPQLSHILRSQDAPSLRGYRRDIRRPIDARIATTILDWIDRTLPR